LQFFSFVSFSFKALASSSSSSYSSNSSFLKSDDEVLYDMDQEATMHFHVGFIACISRDLFTAIEMEDKVGIMWTQLMLFEMC
jgi:hypothetical protein